MSTVIDCNEAILCAFPMPSTPAQQFMYTVCVYRALQALNRPVRCKEIRQWINDNIGFPRGGTVEMVSACCWCLVRMGLAKRETTDGIIREIPREGFCRWAHDVECCKNCKTCRFNEGYSKVLIKGSIAYYSLV